MNYRMLVLSAFLPFLGIGCAGEQAEVPPGHVGKILSSTGLEPDFKNPSSIRLPWVAPLGSKYFLVIAQIGDTAKEEHMEIFMPEDKLVLEFDVRGTFSVLADKEHSDAIFSLPSVKGRDDVTMVIAFDTLYNTYAQQVIRQVARDVISHHSIENVMNAREALSAELQTAVQERLASTPMRVTNFGFAKILPPELIIKAQAATRQREIEIQQAEADRQVKLTQADAALAVAKKRQEVDLVEAETQMMVNKKLAEGVSPSWVNQRALTILEKIAVGQNHLVIMPYEAMTNPALMIGANQYGMHIQPHEPTSPALEHPVGSTN